MILFCIEFRCFSNCEQSANYNEAHAYKGGCKAIGECEGDIIYEWCLSKCLGKLTNCTEVPEEDFSKIRSTPKNIINYNADEGVYDANNWYTLALRGYKNEFVYGENIVAFYVNESPKNGMSHTLFLFKLYGQLVHSIQNYTYSIGSICLSLSMENYSFDYYYYFNTG